MCATASGWETMPGCAIGDVLAAHTTLSRVICQAETKSGVELSIQVGQKL
jgi:hypothetical protein